MGPNQQHLSSAGGRGGGQQQQQEQHRNSNNNNNNYYIQQQQNRHDNSGGVPSVYHRHDLVVEQQNNLHYENNNNNNGLRSAMRQRNDDEIFHDEHDDDRRRRPATSTRGGGGGGSSINLPSFSIDGIEDSDQTDDDDDRTDADHGGDDDDEITRKWKENVFAVGCTNPTWQSEDVNCARLCKSCCTGSPHSYIHCTACFCGTCCRAGRVGNMIVLYQSNDQEIILENGRRFLGPKLRWVVGPYWVVTLVLTIPLFSLLIAWTAIKALNEFHIVVVLIWVSFIFTLFFSLFMVACSDPGVLYRHTESPTEQRQQQTHHRRSSRRVNSNDNVDNNDNDDDDDDWIWNDQAISYRPSHAKFDPECGVVIEEFDHTCPWTGTAIGKKNMGWFRVFVLSVVGVILLSSSLLAWARVQDPQ